jgi:hypothetical protein
MIYQTKRAAELDENIVDLYFLIGMYERKLGNMTALEIMERPWAIQTVAEIEIMRRRIAELEAAMDALRVRF